jgi:hypothetical protein
MDQFEAIKDLRRWIACFNDEKHYSLFSSHPYTNLLECLIRHPLSFGVAHPIVRYYTTSLGRMLFKSVQ